MATLPTNLKDDILDASVNQRRRYNMITNPDGTVEFEDVTAYSQVGSEYGAGLINETNKQINGKVDDSKIVRDLKTIGAMTQEGFIPDALALKEVNESLTADNAQTFQFAYDSVSGKYGYKVKEADTDVFVPFKSGGNILSGLIYGYIAITDYTNTVTNHYNYKVSNVNTLKLYADYTAVYLGFNISVYVDGTLIYTSEPYSYNTPNAITGIIDITVDISKYNDGEEHTVSIVPGVIQGGGSVKFGNGMSVMFE